MTIESNPEINVDWLMDKIRSEIAREKWPNRPLSISQVDTTEIGNQINYIEGFINTAQIRSQIRSELPERFHRFPLNLLKPLQSLLLKILQVLFKDQREVNFNILVALKESLQLNRQLLQQIETLQSQTSQDLQYLNDRFGLLDHCVKGDTLQVEIIEKKLRATVSQVQELQEHCSLEENYLKNDLIYQKQLLMLLLEESKKHLPDQ